MERTLLKQVAKASRNSEFTWRYAANLPATLSYGLHRPKISAPARQILDQLNRDGVAIANVSDVLSESSLFDEMSEAVAELERTNAELLEADRKLADSPAEVGERKPYVRYLLGERPVLDLDSVFVRFALQQPIMRIANAYFGMQTRLAYLNLWHTYKSTVEAQSSQLWHRDFDDPYYIMKVFVYLTDVDEGSGPLSYAAGSHCKGNMKRDPDYISKTSHSRRSNDEQMAAAIPRDRWIPALGPKGTIVFADTHGYHKGGWAKDNERIVYTCMFTSPTVQLRPDHEQFQRPADFQLPADSEEAAVLAPRA